MNEYMGSGTARWGAMLGYISDMNNRLLDGVKHSRYTKQHTDLIRKTVQTVKKVVSCSAHRKIDSYIAAEIRTKFLQDAANLLGVGEVLLQHSDVLKVFSAVEKLQALIATKIVCSAILEKGARALKQLKTPPPQ